MKKISILFLTFLGVSFSYAQGSLGNNDLAAKKILDAVSSKFKTYKAVQSSFTLKVEDAKGKVQEIKKGIVYMKGPKYRVSITGKTGNEIFSDGKNVWSYDKAANEVTISEVDASSGTITPQKLFTNFYDKDFLYKLNGVKTEGKKKLQEIELTPIDKTKNFHKIYLLVDNATNTIYSTKLLDKGGIRYSYTVSNLNGKANIADGIFLFDKKKYPGVEEVDLR